MLSFFLFLSLEPIVFLLATRRERAHHGGEHALTTRTEERQQPASQHTRGHAAAGEPARQPDQHAHTAARSCASSKDQAGRLLAFAAAAVRANESKSRRASDEEWLRGSAGAV